jgi:hypothetical protein
MKKILFFVALGIIVSACSNSGSKTQLVDQPEQNEIVITNDMENAMGVIPSWFNENHVIAMSEPKAHSGEYACLTNDSMQYSYYYKEIVKNIKNGNPKLVNFSGWVYTTVANPNFAIVCSVNENQKQYEWKAYPLDKELTETGKWVEFSANFYFDKKPLNPEHEIGIFAWNQSKKNVYIDDLKITFYYE